MSIAITSFDAEYIALFNAREECSLYEIPGELNRLIPDSPELVPLCQRAVLKLLQDGLVCVLYEDSHHCDPLDQTQAEAIVVSEAAWRLPQDQDLDI